MPAAFYDLYSSFVTFEISHVAIMRTLSHQIRWAENVVGMDKIRKRQEIVPQYLTNKPKNDTKCHQSRDTLTRSVSTLDTQSLLPISEE